MWLMRDIQTGQATFHHNDVRYHTEQWHDAPPPEGMKETFNHAHAKVRNVIERSFGVLKMKFRILLNMPSFPEESKLELLFLVWLFIISFERAKLQIGNLVLVMRMKIIGQCLVLLHPDGQKMNLLLKIQT